MQPLEPADPREIGPYRPLARLGAGGMGIVYLARSRGGRAVAVKVIRPALADDPGFRARFAREVAAARRVGGAFTCPVLDAGTAADPPWLATAYVAGPSLQEAVDVHGPLPSGTLRGLAAGLAEALASVHAAGLVHRDLKPSNVLLAGDGPRIIDFGIARAADATTLTATGVLVGSAGYMSPEQATGGETGPPGDVFALGAVLVFAATGRGPFGTGPAPALLHRVVHRSPDLAGVPGELREVIAACLDKDPRRRPLPAELIDAPVPAAAWTGPGPLNGEIEARETQLVTLLDRGRTRVAGRPGRPGRRAFVAAALAGAGVAAAGGGAALWAARGRRGDRVRQRWSLRSADAFTRAGTAVGGRFLYRDGEALHAVDAGTGRRLWSFAAGGDQETPIVARPSSVLVMVSGAVLAVDPARGAARRLYEAPEGRVLHGLLGAGDGSFLMTLGPTFEADPSSDIRDQFLVAANLADGTVRRTIPVRGVHNAVQAGNVLFLHDRRGRLVALDLTAGTVRWEYQATDAAGPPVAAGNAVYLTDARGVHALDAATGRERWTYSTAKRAYEIAVSGGALYGFAGGTPFSLDAATGRSRWMSPADAAGVVSKPVIASGLVFAGVTRSRSPRPDGVHGGVFAWDAATGEPAWRHPHTVGATPETDGGRAWILTAAPGMVFAAHHTDLLAFTIT
ncbi:protein kinase domain-containing protein [Actinomadura rugatobispora]|uniref:PQQ-binding-like beta-propeller repeat protein n=1 Tax=Actinomadura rugatobispora TaxID=1994 RepID=A0ABW1A707_9ACTN|nr:hypothetical protein GCM10010200_107250 [Actinomadura rugatobispora]